MGGLGQTDLICFGMSAAGCLVSAAVTRRLLPAYCRMAAKAGWLRPNYKGERIPVSAGAIMVLAFLAAGVPVLLVDKLVRLDTGIEQALLLAVGMGFLGLLDDMVGSREAAGLKGHLRKWVMEGEVTTGLLKAAGGLMLALGAAVAASPAEHADWNGKLVLSILLDGLVIALMANWINLLDVRPGRALKASLLKIGGLLWFVPFDASVLLLLLAGAVAAYFPADLRGRAMMGDVGANFIGGMLGYAIVRSFGLAATAGVLAVLAGLHWYTESRSLSKLIEQNRWLTWMDELGRDEAQ
ncbi:hypothetical protein [Effusibacillus pohliae]|uniref:hypothetical protein n=1 Tax=Effusibacillus pohliae TaxID=232270 RepID=UPI00036106E5|nr:hypothetical protein [Effusibacillus pohliae]